MLSECVEIMLSNGADPLDMLILFENNLLDNPILPYCDDKIKYDLLEIDCSQLFLIKKGQRRII